MGGSRNMTGKSVLDYGCGSGVLSLAAALKGASRLVAVDHDPQALESTAENARRNNLDGHIEVLLPKAYGELPANLKKFDVKIGRASCREREKRCVVGA